MTNPLVLAVLAALGLGGFMLLRPSTDDRVEKTLRESLDRQAEYNKTILQQNREVTEAARKLVEADAIAREEIAKLHKGIQSEREALTRMQEAIDKERRILAAERIREPVLAAAIENAGYLLAIGSTLALCVYLLHRLAADTADTVLKDLLLQDLVSATPLLLPAAACRASASLPAPKSKRLK